MTPTAISGNTAPPNTEDHADKSALRRDFLPPQLEEMMHHFGIEGTVAVQARQTLEETSWLLALSEKHPLIRGVVGWVPLHRRRTR